MRVRAVLDQEDPFGPAQGGDPLDVERDVTADVHDDRRARAVARDLRLEVRERQAQVLAVAVHERHRGAGMQGGQRRRHERIRRAQDRLAAHARERERRERRPRPAGERHRVQAVPRRPRRLEALG